MSDWTSESADTIERAVATVRDRTVEPVQAATRAVVHGLLVALLVVPALLLLLAGVFRALVELYQGEVWAAWLTLGGIFVVGGALLWARRNG